MTWADFEALMLLVLCIIGGPLVIVLAVICMIGG